MPETAQFTANSNAVDLHKTQNFCIKTGSADKDLETFLIQPSLHLSKSQQDMLAAVYNKFREHLSKPDSFNLAKNLTTFTCIEGARPFFKLTQNQYGAGEKIIDQKYKNKSTLESLYELAMSKEKIASEVVTGIAQDITDRFRITQGHNATCPVTAAQWHLCGKSPALYASQIAEAVITGKVRDSGGKEIMNLPQPLPYDGRPITCRIYQSMMMAAAGYKYDPATDTFANGQKGLHSTELESVLEKTLQTAFKREERGSPTFQKSIAENIESGKLTVAAIRGIGSREHSLHDVTIVDSRDGFVYFRNPWGRFLENENQGGSKLEVKNQSIYSLPLDQFLKRCEYLVLETNNKSDLGVDMNARDLKSDYFCEPVEFFTIAAQSQLGNQSSNSSSINKFGTPTEKSILSSSGSDDYKTAASQETLAAEFAYQFWRKKKEEDK